MISHQHILEIIRSYDLKNVTIGVLGGHSALDVCHGAKKYGFRTLAVCQKGREQTYEKYYKTRIDMDVVPGQLEPWHSTKGCIDEILIVEKFEDIIKPEIQQQLRDLNTIFIHNRYFWVYCNFEKIEKDFMVPVFGTREMLKLEERDIMNNQYDLLKKAGIRFPQIFSDPEQIDRLSLVKVNEAHRAYERAFFFAQNPEDFQKKAAGLLASGVVSEQSLKKAVIEEFIVGAQVNFNYFYSPLDDELELMGTDTRRQTNLDGLLRLPAPEQIAALKYTKPRMIETGHTACTIKESLLEKAFEIGEKFVTVSREASPTGIIGPFALQGAVAAEEGKEELVIFDVSLRIPGSPGIRYTPYSGYLYGESLSYGERIAMEIQTGIKSERLELLVT